MTASSLVLVLTVAAAPLSPRAAAHQTAAPAAMSLRSSEADVTNTVATYLSAIDPAITSDQWRALGTAAVPTLEAVVLDRRALPSRRARAVGALSAIGGARARQRILEVVHAEGEPFAVRAAALRASAAVLSPQDLAADLEPVVRGPSTAPIRATAAEVLAQHAPASCTSVRAQAAREHGPARAQFGRALERCATR